MNQIPAAVLGATAWLLVLVAVGVETTLLVSIGFVSNSFAAVALLLLGTLPLALALLAKKLRHELIAGSGEVATFVLLFILFFLAWITTWESQWFEPKLTYETERGADVDILIGATRPPRWNLGRIVAATLAGFWAIGFAGLAAPSAWRRYPEERRVTLIVSFLVATVLVLGSVLVLTAREDARRQHARDACYQVEVAEGLEPSVARNRCRDA